MVTSSTIVLEKLEITAITSSVVMSSTDCSSKYHRWVASTSEVVSINNFSVECDELVELDHR